MCRPSIVAGDIRRGEATVEIVIVVKGNCNRPQVVSQQGLAPLARQRESDHGRPHGHRHHQQQHREQAALKGLATWGIGGPNAGEIWR
jgi:hypothetical protein